MADYTVYDSAFKTMVRKIPKLIVPFVNEAFGRGYAEGTAVVPLNDSHEPPGGQRITDSAFLIEGALYHIECQSTPDADVVGVSAGKA